MARHYNQSRYVCKHPEKYVGDATNIIARSGWERDFFKYCDMHPSVIRWGSEEIALEYVSPLDNRVHRYFPDLIVELKTVDDKIVKMLIEIKPDVQTRPPVKPKKINRSYADAVATYIINQAKWKAAENFCLKNGMKFQLITENELYGKGKKI